ncbi:CsbD family protein [Candidatus Gracilibacteria bacterium]|nr:CsbD family protein [Candidatus Gracilibacteria bacterium]
MNWDIVEGKWEQAKGHIRKKFNELTDDEIDEAKADGQILSGKLQEKYGWTKEEADDKVNDIQDEISKM